MAVTRRTGEWKFGPRLEFLYRRFAIHQGVGLVLTVTSVISERSRVSFVMQ